MPSISCCGILPLSRREDGSGQPTQSTAPIRPTTVNERVRPHSARSTSISRSSAPIPATAYRTRDPNILAQNSIQNSPQKPAVPTNSEPHIQPNLWEKARATLSDDDKAWIERVTGDVNVPVHNVVDEIIVLATKKQRLCEEKRWKRTVRLGEVKISLENITSTIIVWLNKFKEIGDIVVQYDPVHAALPWAVARFILLAAVTAEEQMAASLAILERTTRIVHRCQVFEGLYNRTTVDHAVINNLESALIQLYACVLRGLVTTNEFLSKRTPSQFFAAIFHPTTNSNLLASLEAGEIQVDREIVACEGRLKAKIEARYHDQLRGLLELTEPILRTDENIKKILQLLDRDELTRVLQWISPIEYRRHHDTVKELRTKGTCGWLLQRPKFAQWSSATTSITLWLQGFPGSGKTYLTSRVIEDIEETLIGKQSDESFAFFYCNRNEDNRRKALDILRSYIRQLSTTPQRLGYICPQLKELYTDSGLRGSGWTLGQCHEYLVKLLNLYPRTTLILDALDECIPEERTSLLDFFDSIPSKSSKPVRIFISSRPEGDIRQRLVHLSNIEIQATDNENDIAKFVMQSIDRNGRWSGTLRENQPLKNEIVETLLSKSNGMFQWAMLQIKQLLNVCTEREIRNRLGKLPKDLKAAYDEILAVVEALDADARTLSFRALRWVMCAYKPLTSQQLLAAIHVDPERETVEGYEIKETHLLDWCVNLLRIDAQQSPPVWRVSHLSVVEYLETRWTVLDAHCHVAKASLILLRETYGCEDWKDPLEDSSRFSYASQEWQETESVDIFHPDHPLQTYVRHDWIRHVQTQECEDPDPKLAYLLRAFLGSLQDSGVQYRRWHRHITISKHQLPVPYDQISPSTCTAFLVCRCSFYAFSRDWWDKPLINLSQLADSGDDFLTLAAAAGCKPICVKLLELGMPVNTPGRTKGFGSALVAAALWGDIEIVRLLVENGADINMLLRVGDYGSALAAAAFLGDNEIVRFLVGKGADINIVLWAGRYGSALAAAACSGHIEIVRFLVENGADINMLLRVGYYGSALAAAAYRGDIKIVRFFVENGAYINMLLWAGDYGSALAAAAYEGYMIIIRFFVENGAYINMLLWAGDYGSALAAAAYEGYMIIIRFFVENGADINMPLRAGRYGSALAAAAAGYRSHVDLIKFLVDNGANINMPLQVGNYGSALAAAAGGLGPKFNIVKFLVDKGADINMRLQTGMYSSAIEAAEKGGNAEIIDFLRNRKAGINTQL